MTVQSKVCKRLVRVRESMEHKRHIISQNKRQENTSYHTHTTQHTYLCFCIEEDGKCLEKISITAALLKQVLNSGSWAPYEGWMIRSDDRRGRRGCGVGICTKLEINVIRGDRVGIGASDGRGGRRNVHDEDGRVEGVVQLEEERSQEGVLFVASFAIYDMITLLFQLPKERSNIVGRLLIRFEKPTQSRQARLRGRFCAGRVPAGQKMESYHLPKLASENLKHCIARPERQNVLGLCLLLTTVRQTAPRPISTVQFIWSSQARYEDHARFSSGT